MNFRNLTLAGGALLAMIVAWEGNKFVPYQDVGGIPTVCAGHTGDDVENRPYSPQECAAILKVDVYEHGIAMLRCIDVPISQDEYDAYVSFSYNVGVKAFCDSTLNKKLHAGDREGACNELLKWNKAGGRVMRGLTNRRKAERELCLKGVYGSAN